MTAVGVVWPDLSGRKTLARAIPRWNANQKLPTARRAPGCVGPCDAPGIARQGL